MVNLKKADEGELDKINKLIFDSEMVSTDEKSNMKIFAEKYIIKESDILENKSYVLYEEQLMIGFFMVKDKGTTHELEYFYIKRDRLGKGYGKVMWSFVDGICIKNNIRSIHIVCGKNITPFYIKMGAEKIGEIYSKVNSRVKIDLLQYQVKQK